MPKKQRLDLTQIKPKSKTVLQIKTPEFHLQNVVATFNIGIEHRPSRLAFKINFQHIQPWHSVFGVEH